METEHSEYMARTDRRTGGFCTPHYAGDNCAAVQQQQVRDIEALTFQQVRRNTLMAVAAIKRQ